jgi:hypothetical protein
MEEMYRVMQHPKRGLSPLRLCAISLLSAAVACAGSSAGPTPPPVERPPVEGGTRLTAGTALYPRVIRLAHNGAANGRLLMSYVAFPGGEYGEGHVVESSDDGRTWSTSPVGIVRDESSHGLCCSTLYELPAAAGALAEGTLLWAASIGQDQSGRRMALRVWKSGDLGRTWSYLSSCANAANTGGLWEPEFSMTASGTLVCHYSDETLQPAHSQVLARVESTDGGATWGPRILTVASANPAHRPGMPVVRRMPDGVHVMTYEICGVAGANCATYIRSSADGASWGDSSALGTRIVSTAGHFFAHAPVVAVRPDGATGGLVLIGQLLEDAGERQVAGSGGTLMVTTGHGDGPWTEVAGPLTVTDVYDNYCPNYSSSLLPSLDGSRVLVVATAYVGQLCTAFYGTGAAPR